MLAGALEEESLSTSWLAAPQFLCASDSTCAMEPTLKCYSLKKRLSGLKGQLCQSRLQSSDRCKTLKTSKKPFLSFFFARL